MDVQSGESEEGEVMGEGIALSQAGTVPTAKLKITQMSSDNLRKLQVTQNALAPFTPLGVQCIREPGSAHHE